MMPTTTKTSAQKFVFAGYNKSQLSPNTTEKTVIAIVAKDYDIITNKHNGSTWVARTQEELDAELLLQNMGEPVGTGSGGGAEWRVQFNGPINTNTSGIFRIKGLEPEDFNNIDLWCETAPNADVTIQIFKGGAEVFSDVFEAALTKKQITLPVTITAGFDDILTMAISTTATLGTHLTMRVY